MLKKVITQRKIYIGLDIDFATTEEKPEYYIRHFIEEESTSKQGALKQNSNTDEIILVKENTEGQKIEKDEEIVQDTCNIIPTPPKTTNTNTLISKIDTQNNEVNKSIDEIISNKQTEKKKTTDIKVVWFQCLDGKNVENITQRLIEATIGELIQIPNFFKDLAKIFKGYNKNDDLKYINNLRCKS